MLFTQLPIKLQIMKIIKFIANTVSLVFKSILDDYSAQTSVNQSDEDLQMRALAKTMGGDHRGAIEDYTQALLNEQNNIEAYLNRGNARSALGDYKGAIEDYTQVLRLNPQDARAYLNRSNARREMRDYQGAIEDSNQVLRLGSKDASACVSRGLSGSESEAAPETVNDCDQVLLINPDDIAEKYNQRIASYKLRFQQGNLGEGLEQLFKE